jgi:hypothetical protein
MPLTGDWTAGPLVDPATYLRSSHRTRISLRAKGSAARCLVLHSGTVYQPRRTTTGHAFAIDNTCMGDGRKSSYYSLAWSAERRVREGRSAMSSVDTVLTANEIVPTGREGDIAHVGDDCGPVDHDSDSYRGGIGDERPIDLVIGCANVRSIRTVVKGLIDSVRAPIKYNALTGGLEAK